MAIWLGKRFMISGIQHQHWASNVGVPFFQTNQDSTVELDMIIYIYIISPTDFFEKRFFFDKLAAMADQWLWDTHLLSIISPRNVSQEFPSENFMLGKNKRIHHPQIYHFLWGVQPWIHMDSLWHYCTNNPLTIHSYTAILTYGS